MFFLYLLVIKKYRFMKKNIILLLFCSIILLSFSVSQEDKENHIYSEGVSFRVTGVYKEKMISESQNINRIAPKNTRYVSLALKFKNDTNEKQIIDFEDFYLLDKNDNKYRVTRAVQGMKFTMTDRKMEFELKSGASKTYIIGFTPPFPKDQEINRILVKEEVVKFK